ncbi:general APC amino acid permease [Thelephora ganbajun]|uniref:General APC amino acid permease n=1 Tax=Thelephora ganbajun TaxID=370292 RepID=A0ACB6Z8F5_THEGA|nr:general APC amino acid permease [Thelephora ganbajun]
MDVEKKAASGAEKDSQSAISVESHLDAREKDKVQRKLQQRHVQMIAIAGTLGTGLFLGSGFALQGAGPLGALIAYALVGTVAYSSLCAVGEMAAFNPTSGTFPHFAARWVDKALGFAIGWNYFYGSVMAIPTEISAAAILITFWDDNPNHAPAYIAAILVVMISFNLFGVRYFGEAEFYFCLVKIMLIIGLIIAGLVITLGGGPDRTRRGFQYWKNPGAIARAGLVDNIDADKFLAILSVIVQAAFSFQSMELVAIAASETESPRRNIAKAVKRVFWRILIFYILGVLITGMLVPYNDPELLHETGNAAQSPYVIAINRARIKVLPHIINAAIFTSAFSAGNSFLYSSSRVLFGLSIRGQAPKIFGRVTKGGLPLISVAFCSLFSLLTFMTVSNGAATVFGWLVNLTTVGGFIGWWVINCTYLCFHYGYKKQGFNRKELLYYSPLQPYLAWWGIFWATFFVVISGLQTWFKWNTSTFLTFYINIPIFIAMYFGYKVVKKTRIRRWDEMDFVTGIPTPEETEIPEVPPKNIWEKISSFIF